MNLAIKATLGDPRSSTIKDALKILGEMHEDFEQSRDTMTEMCVKSHNDVWIVGRRSDQREFYVIISKKDASLVEINGTRPAGMYFRVLTRSATLF